MSLTLYNTLNRKKEPFSPIDPADVRMYVCGPTVYDFAHIGNARPVIVFDVLFRLLQHLAAKGEWDGGKGETSVTYVRNITDVDDKINDRAARDYPDLPLNEAIRKVTESTAEQFHLDVAALGCLPPTVEPRATDNIQEMVGIINRLIGNGHAYIAKGDQGREVLFEVGSMPAYGALSNRKLDEQIEGARVAVEAHKRHAADFVLWKESSPSEPGWEGGFVEGGAAVSIYGRPGWHIECSAMSHRYLGETFDIHGGGIDLVFPHHENEIAQSCCAFGRDVMANVWMHNGFLQVEGQKMSKSLGNFLTIHELLATRRFGSNMWHGRVLRLAVLKTHYRQPIDFTADRLLEARVTLKKWIDAVIGFETTKPINVDILEALSDDLNFSEVFVILSELYNQAKGRLDKEASEQLGSAMRFLGLWDDEPSLDILGYGLEIREGPSDSDIQSLIDARIEARRTKNFAESDLIRDQLVAMDIQLKDGKDANGNPTTTWEVKR